MTAIDGSTRFGSARDHVSGAVDSDLRADVRYLGELLGRVLRESGGDDLLRDVESLRAAVITAYEGYDADGAARAEAVVAACPPSGPKRSPAPSPRTSTWRTWPRSTTACACSGSAATTAASRGTRFPATLRANSSTRSAPTRPPHASTASASTPC